MERIYRNKLFGYFLFIPFFGCEWIDEQLTVQNLYSPKDETLELFMNHPYDGKDYIVDWNSQNSKWYIDVENETKPRTRVFWTSPDSFTVYHMNFPITEPIINYSTYSKDDGTGKQMIYLNSDMIGKRLWIIGCINEDICEVLSFQLK